VRVENAALRQEWDNIEMKYRKVAVLAAQQKKDEVNMRKSVVELCFELPDM
jgi:hypothetical protein